MDFGIRAIGRIFLLLIAIGIYYSGPARANEVLMSKGQTVYLPVYSHIYHGDRQAKFKLTATIIFRNTDAKEIITIKAADYYDSEGQKLASHIGEPLDVKPLASIHYLVKESDMTGGAGASFIIRWESEVAVTPPIIQSVMIGTESTQGISFLSEGRVIEERK